MMSDELQAAHTLRYSMHIAWSEKDGAYLVTLPEWMPRLINSIAVTHGKTYEQAAENGREVLEMLIEQAQAHSEPLPQPNLIEYEDGTEVVSA
ncbi:MAG: type II toxin-antitoxin system HicB family antitoxin [Ktedonobacterales bacterium]